MGIFVDRRAGYSAASVAKALFVLAGSPAGRFELMERVGLTEAPARTMMKKLAAAGMIKPTIEGAVLTKKGRDLVAAMRRHMPRLPEEVDAENYTDSGLYRKLYKGRVDMAVRVRGAASRVRDGVEQRDIAVKAGAVGATTLVQKRGRLVFPATWYEIKKEFGDYIRGKFGPKDDDVIVICFGPSPLKVEEAALAVALSLM